MTTCTVTWDDQDVYIAAEDHPSDPLLTEEEVKWILSTMERDHDATIGITWDTVNLYIDRVLEKRKSVERDSVIYDLAQEQWAGQNIDFNIEYDVSEGDDNGAYIKAWLWVSFKDTELDKYHE